jgi:hypothetical protein
MVYMILLYLFTVLPMSGVVNAISEPLMTLNFTKRMRRLLHPAPILTEAAGKYVSWTQIAG